ncbi:MAG: hypothetical protein WCK16_04780 [Candidatus Moraniibacteriota bacterium]
MKNKKNKQLKKNQAGFMMIEAVFSIFIVGTILITFMAVMGSVYRTEFAKRDLIIASNLAQEGIEIVRNRRDDNWKKGCPAFSGGACVNGGNGQTFPIVTGYMDYLTTSITASASGSKIYKNTYGFYDHVSVGGTVTKFSRIIAVTTPSIDSRTIKVTVSWDSKNIEMTDTLYAWGDRE